MLKCWGESVRSISCTSTHLLLLRYRPLQSLGRKTGVPREGAGDVGSKQLLLRGNRERTQFDTTWLLPSPLSLCRCPKNLKSRERECSAFFRSALSLSTFCRLSPLLCASCDAVNRIQIRFLHGWGKRERRGRERAVCWGKKNFPNAEDGGGVREFQ